MDQTDAVRSWWAALDQVGRVRTLRLADDDLLPEDLAMGLAIHGVTVVPLGLSPVDDRPDGWVPPDVLLDLLDEVRRA